jgi:hypothetical protein
MFTCKICLVMLAHDEGAVVSRCSFCGLAQKSSPG